MMSTLTKFPLGHAFMTHARNHGKQTTIHPFISRIFTQRLSRASEISRIKSLWERQLPRETEKIYSMLDGAMDIGEKLCKEGERMPSYVDIGLRIRNSHSIFTYVLTYESTVVIRLFVIH